MRIRKKTSKSPSKPPLYAIGYRFSAPSSDELKIWYDLEYGGPLTLEPSGISGALAAAHGPWHAQLRISLLPDEVESITQYAAWDHHHAGTVAPAAASPAVIADTVLFASRLARGLTLLTQGTALDLVLQRHSNPSDWSDRPLSLFDLEDHLEITQGETEEDAQEWFHTLGLRKFGLDELEIRQPKGLPDTLPRQVLTEAADEALRSGQNAKVGSTIAIPSLGRSVTVIKHRTATARGSQHIFREVALA